MTAMDDEEDLARDVVVARKYNDILHEALRTMRAVTEEHGPPTADALITAITFTLDKARSVSVQAGVEFVADRDRGDEPGAWWTAEGGE